MRQLYWTIASTRAGPGLMAIFSVKVIKQNI